MIMSMYKQVCITDRHLVAGDFLQQIRKVLSSGVDLLILREKDMSPSDYRKLASEVVPVCEKYGVICMLHSYVEVAKEINHPYIHLPYEAFCALNEEERKWFRMIGVSTHTVEEAIICQKLNASYITASHIFETACKQGLKPRGLIYLSEVCEAVNIPVYALGGINKENASECIEAGATGVCMMSGWMRL